MIYKFTKKQFLILAADFPLISMSNSFVQKNNHFHLYITRFWVHYTKCCESDKGSEKSSNFSLNAFKIYFRSKIAVKKLWKFSQTNFLRHFRQFSFLQNIGQILFKIFKDTEDLKFSHVLVLNLIFEQSNRFFNT